MESMYYKDKGLFSLPKMYTDRKKLETTELMIQGYTQPINYLKVIILQLTQKYTQYIKQNCHLMNCKDEANIFHSSITASLICNMLGINIMNTYCINHKLSRKISAGWKKAVPGDISSKLIQ